jgi:hypothetical protein
VQTAAKTAAVINTVQANGHRDLRIDLPPG